MRCRFGGSARQRTTAIAGSIPAAVVRFEWKSALVLGLGLVPVRVPVVEQGEAPPSEPAPAPAEVAAASATVAF